MATTTLLPAITTMNTSKYFMDVPQAGPSPPDSKTSSGAPMSRTPPSTNISPTNFHSSANHRQLRQPRQPLYVPAALRPTDSKSKLARPTDIPGRPRAPDTPPASQESSYDSAHTESPLTVDFGSGSPILDEANPDLVAMRKASSQASSNGYNPEELGEVKGPPSTAHWKPDESSTTCWVCNETFTWYFRRHHCRRCGELTCDYHIRYNVPLDHNARFHPDGTVSKACKKCHDEWKVLRKLHHHSRAGSIAESSDSSQGTAMPIPNSRRGTDDFRVGSMARSEGGMVWSTF